MQSKGKEENLTLSFNEFLSTLGDAESMSFNVKWLVSHVIAFRDLNKVGPSTHAYFSLLQQLRVKRASCITKAEETKLAIKAHIILVTQLQESISKLEEDLSSKLEAGSTLDTQLKGVEEEHGSLNKEIEKLEGDLGSLSHLDFSLENVNTLIDII